MNKSSGFLLVLLSNKPSLQPTQVLRQALECHLMVKNKKDTAFQAQSILEDPKATTWAHLSAVQKDEKRSKHFTPYFLSKVGPYISTNPTTAS